MLQFLEADILSPLSIDMHSSTERGEFIISAIGLALDIPPFLRLRVFVRPPASHLCPFSASVSHRRCLDI